MSADVVQVVREVPVSRDRLFAAWTVPDMVAAWWGTGAQVSVDLRPGGSYRWYRTWGDDWMAIVGQFETVQPGEYLAASFAWEGDESQVSRLEVSFSDTPEGSAITLTHTDLPDAQQVSNHTQGWNDCLNRMVAYLTE